jgi:uncharacterized membrane protein
MSPPIAYTARRRRPGIRLGAALGRRRRLRTGLVQSAYIVGAIGLGLLIPQISVGTTIESRSVREMLVAVGAAFVPFIGIIYSLLFLVVQFGTTTFTPRLNLFRDAPIVWHGFSFFTGVIVFAFTAALAIGKDDQTTLLLPIAVIVLVLVAIGMFRTLQSAAFTSIQLAATLAAVARRGRQVVDGVYPDPFDGATSEDGAPSGVRPTNGRDVLWPGRPATLQAIDIPRLMHAAQRTDAVIEVCVWPGDVLPEQSRVGVIHGGDQLEERELIRALQVGIERTFDQDPGLALRVLADIALRALSPAVNDPTTAVQALDQTDGLLRVIVNRELAVGTICSTNGEARVLLQPASFDDYVGIALDETIEASAPHAQVRRRVVRLLTDLAVIAPPARRASLDMRLERIRPA